MKKIFTSLMLGAVVSGSMAQSAHPVQAPANAEGTYRCGQVQYENHMRAKDPLYDAKKEEAMKQIAAKVKEMESSRQNGNQPFATYTIPIVVHVVYNTAAQNVTDAKVQAMIVQLNQDWSRTNSDAGNTPAPWQSVAADMQIQFCLATKDPSGAATTGIIHKQTSTATFQIGDVQSASTGGDDPWDVNKYLNIWTCNFGGGLLGYGQFPPVSSSYGTAIHYCTVGSLTNPGTCSPFGYGRTLSHEIGHCFSLYHIWGDDGGACTGDDQCADTPNQADATSGCYSFPHTDGCTSTGNGIMYMNIMDYSDDQCYNMFTTDQKTRCQSAISSYLMSIANNATTVCGAASAIDAGINAIISPNGVACNTTFTPVVTLQNYGANALTSATINYRVDANPNQTFAWTGNLASGASTNVTLPSVTTTSGSHTFTSSTTVASDGNPGNDQSTSNFTVASTINPPIVEGIEGTFPAAGWTINNPDAATTWAKTSVAFKSGANSMFMDDFNYQGSGQIDELIIPPVNLQFMGSPTMTFEVAYQLYTDPATSPNFSDTLRVMISTDCGATWTTPYFKYGSTGATQLTTIVPAFSVNSFTPTANDWRLETISLPQAASVLVKFKHTCNYENQMYVDDINISGTGNPFVQENNIDNYVSVYPNPSNGSFSVYISATDFGAATVKVVNVLGEVISEASDNGTSSKKFSFNLASEANGIYFVEVKTEKGSSTKKVMLNK